MPRQQQARFKLPGDRETVIYPLTFAHHAAAPNGQRSDAHGDSIHHGSPRPEAHASRDGTLLGLLVAEAPEIPLGAPIQDSPPAVDPAAVDYAFAQTSGVPSDMVH